MNNQIKDNFQLKDLKKMGCCSSCQIKCQSSEEMEVKGNVFNYLLYNYSFYFNNYFFFKVLSKNMF